MEIEEPEISPELAHMLFDHHMKQLGSILVPIWKKEREVKKEMNDPAMYYYEKTEANNGD